ncbi:MAG: helix-turn-helix domain-containing protein [Actinobacteria bacterium]|nr:helix-turn-helix domain-containing protein [Actinomycetota bacterium]
MVDISLHDVADELGVHYMTVYRYVRQGLLPATKRGRTWYVAPSDVEAFRSSRVAVAEEPSPTGRRSAPWAQRLESRLVEGDERGALEVLESALRAGNDVSFVYLDVMAPALASIGERWAAGELGIHVEHRASGIVLRLIGLIGSRFKHRGPQLHRGWPASTGWPSTPSRSSPRRCRVSCWH